MTFAGRYNKTPSNRRLLIGLLTLLSAHPAWELASGQAPSSPVALAEERARQRFETGIVPLLARYCIRCHNAEEMESGVRLDRLDGGRADRNLFLWRDVREQLGDEVMPPEDEPQPSDEDRKRWIGWIDEVLLDARTRENEHHGSVRRLTVEQYRNTLRDLLGLQDDLTGVLPPDSVSRHGFANNGPSMLLSPLLVEAFFDIAEQSLDACIVDPGVRPTIQSFRMDLGRSINPRPCPDDLVLGANSMLLANEDFVVSQVQPEKSFPYDRLSMRTEYRFNEGYAGNATVRGWRTFDSIYHAVFACVRGSRGYPHGQLPYQVVPEGLLLRPAIPVSEVFGESSTFGARANFKIAVRELPNRGKFRVTVRAARYADGLLLGVGAPTRHADQAVVSLASTGDIALQEVTLDEAGVYQVDIHAAPGDPRAKLHLQLGGRHFAGELFGDRQGESTVAAFMLVRLPAGPLPLAARYGDGHSLRRLVLTRLDATDRLTDRFARFERRSPELGVRLGLRRDCGHTMSSVGAPQTVSSTKLTDYVFEGAIRNFPSPDVQPDNDNYLAGVREIFVRSEYTDGRDMPRLLIRSVTFEGPFYETWLPETHRRIFIDSDTRVDRPVYAREVIRSFATRAYRRPVTEKELASLIAVWDASYARSRDWQQSVKDALLVVLTSPQFLFLAETSQGPQAEVLEPYELASKLSYFLWNAAPDDRLLQLAADGVLPDVLEREVDRLIQDERFSQFVRPFATQWLGLHKLNEVDVDRKRYPRLTRHVKKELRKEPVAFLGHLFRENLPVRNLVRSDFLVVNDVVASYYGLGDRSEQGLRFGRLLHGDAHLGGVLSQAGILAGLSDGREANPVKRGAWLARKIIAEPPDDPPPNVPQVSDEDPSLTLRQKLELHRSQTTCAKCHEGIDPWGIPFETMDAGGLFRSETVDARSTLPDKTEVEDLDGLKDYLGGTYLDRVAFSTMKHLASYAVGRDLTFREVVLLEGKCVELRSRDYPMQDMIRCIVTSDLFLTK